MNTANQTRPATAILLISCPDQVGIDAAVTRFVSEHHGNIVDFDQHVDAQENIFFMRIEWELDRFDVERGEIEEAFEPISEHFGMQAELFFSDTVQRMAIFVSKQSHCLYDLLARHASGDWSADIPVILSNHPDLETVAHRFGIDFRVFPIEPQTRHDREEQQLELLEEYGIDFIVLARYMQILSGRFIDRYPRRIINIHHSFLPAFAGARPYHAAFRRGVKLIGATSHYVTEELDAGPIIDQDIIRVSHKDSPATMMHKGKDLEKIVLARAVQWHLQHKVLVYSNKTVVFE